MKIFRLEKLMDRITSLSEKTVRRKYLKNSYNKNIRRLLVWKRTLNVVPDTEGSPALQLCSSDINIYIYQRLWIFANCQ